MKPNAREALLASVYTADTDFLRFSGIEVIDPLRA